MNDRADNLTPDEICILEYLKHWPGQYISRIEIARRAESKARFVNDPNWAERALRNLLDLGMVETNSYGQCCLPEHLAAATVKCGAKTMFVAPHLAEILGKSGRTFDLSA
jgi:hypothetical protein